MFFSKELVNKFKSDLSFQLRPFFSFIYKLIKSSPNVIKTIYYESYLWDQLTKIFDNHLNLFLNNRLPNNFLVGLSERAVELPWFLANINDKKGLHLDAGSSINFREVLFQKKIINKKIIIFNLNPERDYFNQNNISYVYGDLRKKFFSDNLFDSISCISVLEHVGMNNSSYIHDMKFNEHNKDDYLKVIRIFKRILKKGGECFLTVPFGKYEDLNWLQNFDKDMIDRIIKEFKPTNFGINYYKYTINGWKSSNLKACKNCTYSKSYPGKDFCVGAHSVACIKLVK